jgi:fatty-acyl-CoA synthase
VNPAFQTNDLKFALNKVEIKTLVMPESHSKSNYVEIVGRLIPNLGYNGSTTVNSEEVPHLKHVIVGGTNKHKGMINFKELYNIYSKSDVEELAKREQETSFEDAVNIQFTSGTTGFPKGATLSHHSILNNALSHGQIMGYNDDTKLLV